MAAALLGRELEGFAGWDGTTGTSVVMESSDATSADGNAGKGQEDKRGGTKPCRTRQTQIYSPT